MALLKSYDMPNGVALPTAYHRVKDADIQRVVGSDGSDENSMSAWIDIFKDEDSRESGLQPVISFKFELLATNPDFDTFFDMSVLDGTNVNSVRQCYEYLKTQTDINGVEYNSDAVHINYTDSTDI